MKMLNKISQPEAKFDLYFLGYDSPLSLSHSRQWSDRSGLIELTHNYGTETDPDYRVVNGNTEPFRGFGHTCISVDNIQAACKRLEDAGYKFQKKLTDGRMNSIAFVLDPDGYWVEIIGQKAVEETANVSTTDVQTYRMVHPPPPHYPSLLTRPAQNHTMLRVKSSSSSLLFYQEILGMTLLRTSEHPSANFNLYFLGYPSSASAAAPADQRQREGLLELTWNYGTEADEAFAYHSGNEAPQGFGHICISVDDLDAACARFEELGVRWKKRLAEGRMRNVAFLLDPDGYWIEVIQNEGVKERAKW
jgi:lactoylglutathione lyase